jgi:hypothetical protein
MVILPCNVATPYVEAGVRVVDWREGLREIFAAGL